MKKVALFLATGFEETEALGTVDVLRRAQIPVNTVSIANEKTVTGAHGIPVIADQLFNETDFNEIDMIVLPGGMPGSTNLNKDDKVKELLQQFNNSGKQVAAICAAPMVLGGSGLLQGKKATCYPGFETKLIGAQATGKNVVVDGNITTGGGPGLVFEFALSLVEQLAGLEKRQEVQKGLLL